MGVGVLTLGPESVAPGTRIVREVKANKKYTPKQALEELALARQTRDAQVGLFVIARQSASEAWPPMRRVGEDVLVVWDAEDPSTDIFLKAAVSVAGAIAVRRQAAADGSQESLEEIEAAIARLQKIANEVDSVEKSARLLMKHDSAIVASAESMRVALGAQVEALRGTLEGLRATRGGEGV